MILTLMADIIDLHPIIHL